MMSQMIMNRKLQKLKTRRRMRASVMMVSCSLSYLLSCIALLQIYQGCNGGVAVRASDL